MHSAWKLNGCCCRADSAQLDALELVLASHGWNRLLPYQSFDKWNLKDPCQLQAQVLNGTLYNKMLDGTIAWMMPAAKTYCLIAKGAIAVPAKLWCNVDAQDVLCWKLHGQLETQC
jgi:hypothetical protein